MNEYEVTVVRTIPQIVRIRIEAENKAEAKKEAVKRAKNRKIKWISGDASNLPIAVKVAEI